MGNFNILLITAIATVIYLLINRNKNEDQEKLVQETNRLREDLNKLAAQKDDEIETLETNDINQTKLSRLSCQIELKEEFNNITVTIPIPRTLT